MKKAIDHLPVKKQDELKRIVELVSGLVDIEVYAIILFGSHSRGDWVEDRYVEDGITYEYQSDYDLLFVMESERVAKDTRMIVRLENIIRENVKTETPIGIIYHGIEYLNQQIEERNYFFLDIVKEGIQLYHNGKLQISKPPMELNPELVLEKAENYYKQWFESANSFYRHFEIGMKENDFKMSAFMLHQAAERYYTTIALVFTDYRPKTHDLGKLERRSVGIDGRVSKVFPKETKEEERLFELLKDAYIDSRYKLDYKVDREDLEYLGKRVLILREITENICIDRIKALSS